MKCKCCGKEFPDERYEILGVRFCIQCTPEVKPYLGVMKYDHKTGGVLAKTTDPEQFKEMKKVANKRR